MLSFTFPLSVILNVFTIYGAADTACTESGRNYKDGAIVLQAVTSRANGLLGDGKKSLTKALFARAQHAHGCKWPLTRQHWELGYQFVQRNLVVPEWAKKALWYCNLEKPGTCESRCLNEDPVNGCLLLGREAHRFYGRPDRKKISGPPRG